MKISKWDDEHIWFEDGTTITYEHEADCCERNWADFSILDVFYHGEEFDGVKIETVDELGFKLILMNKDIFLGWNSGKKIVIVIPCYSEQNGYYSTDLTIVVTGSDGNRKEYDLVCIFRDEFYGWDTKPDFYWENGKKEK